MVLLMSVITDVSGVMNNILCKQEETVSFKHIPWALSAVDEPTIICIYALPHLQKHIH